MKTLLILLGLALAGVVAAVVDEASAQSRIVTGGTRAGLNGGYCPIGTCNRYGGRWSARPTIRCSAANCRT
jgi:hypothetical protein